MHAPTIAAGSGVAGRWRVLADLGVGWKARGMDVAGKACPGAAWNGGGGAGCLEMQYPCGLWGRVFVRVDFAFGLGGVLRCRSALSVCLNRRMSRCQGCAGLARQASYFLARQESNQRRRPGFAALRFAQGPLRCSIRRAAAQLASLREAQTVLADFPRQPCAARRLTRGWAVRAASSVECVSYPQSRGYATRMDRRSAGWQVR